MIAVNPDIHTNVQYTADEMQGSSQSKPVVQIHPAVCFETYK